MFEFSVHSLYLLLSDHRHSRYGASGVSEVLYSLNIQFLVCQDYSSTSSRGVGHLVNHTKLDYSVLFVQSCRKRLGSGRGYLM